MDQEKYILKKPIETMQTGFALIKVFRTVHCCEGDETMLHHLLVDMR